MKTHIRNFCHRRFVKIIKGIFKCRSYIAKRVNCKLVWINRKYIYHIIIIRLYTFNCNINEALKSCNELEWRHILKNNALKPDLVCNNFVLFKRVPFWLTLLYNMNNYYNDKNYKFVTVYLPNFPMTLNYNGGHNIKHFLAPPTHVFIVQW